MQITGLDHIYVTVSDFAASERFYDRVMKLLGFRKGTMPVAGAPHAHYFNPVMQISIRPAHTGTAVHDPYAPGLHHICLRVDERAAVDEAAAGLGKIGVAATAPAVYPEYAPDYYATFFEDPDGVRFEIVAMRRLRHLIRDHWDELVEFEDPLSKAGLS